MKAPGFSALAVRHPKKTKVHAHPVFEICLFSDRPRELIRDQLAAVMSKFSGDAGDAFTWRKSNTMSKVESLPGTSLAAISACTQGREFAKPGLIGLELFSGDDGGQYAPPSMKLFSSGLEDDEGKIVWRTLLRCCTVVGDKTDGKALLKTILSLLSTSVWTCGHAGLSMYWNTGDTIMEDELGRKAGLFSQYPALGYHDPLSFEPFIGEGLLQIGWVTVVGESLCARLGSKPKAAEFSGSEVRVVDLGKKGGVLMVAGSHPILGSSQPDQEAALDPYKAVGRRLAKIRLPDERIQFFDIAGIDDTDAVRSWYLRFFGEGSQKAGK